MVSVWNPLGIEQRFAEHLIGEIRNSGASKGLPEDLEIDPDKKRAFAKYQNPPKKKLKKVAFLHAKDIMTYDPHILYLDAKVSEAAKAFTESRFRHIPILNSNNRITGILSDRDFLRESEIAGVDREDFSEKSVEDIMTKHVLSVHSNTEVHIMARIFFKERIGALPILSKENKLIGIVTRSDILRTLIQTEIFDVVT
jgi:CBS domain-containing protein